MVNLARTPLLFSLIIILGCCTLGLKAQNKFLKAITPDQAILQYAGSIGYLSAGIGYDFFKEKSSLSFLYGYVPKNKGGELDIAAVKFDYKPFKVKIGNQLVWHPINPVAFVSYTFGQEFGFEFDSNVYADGYYFWSPALREHLGVTSELKILGDGSTKIRSISLYAEANTNDLYAINWYHDRKGIAFTDIFRLGFGLKVNF
ncbi:hypothetical protein SAMN06265348_107230 [Pedobacter westerhofensis]|uniref:Outer membrane protein beta-barrel domain-containing protein n=1 Tax=Pedobacter westerhofensis TaxID=425512 RepID=A0A521E8H9_9SPHI|nr:hypothetical protein [Pedobacter westerhofensis]SMO80255.1 hypothetical protein SAMN06265348_107230 [Pedobacter westerhofensis]